MNVLLVEDDRDLAQNVGEFLESSGHQVDYANDGLLARRLCSEHRYDAIVLDILPNKTTPHATVLLPASAW